MKKISLSFIIPCFNSSCYITKALDSIISQNINNYEIVIVDDSSTDKTIEVINQYKLCKKNQNIRIYKNDINKGPGESRRKGVSLAKGEWIAFCDADDWLNSNYYSTICKYLDSSKIDVIIFDNNVVHNNSVVRANTTTVLKSSKTTNEFLINTYPSLCRFVVKRLLYRDVVFPPLYHGEDGAVVPQIIAFAKYIKVVDVPLYNYYMRRGSNSHNISKNVYKELCASYNILVNSLPDKYQDEIEFIGIKTILYGALLCLFKANSHYTYAEANNLVSKFYEKYPYCEKNKYFCKQRISIKKIFILAAMKHMYIINYLYAKLHVILIK